MGLETQQFSSSDNKKPADTGEFDENILPKGAVLQSRYEIIKVLGVGGMGAVYLAQDLRFTGVTRMCAVKEMISTTPDPHVRRLAVQSFEREANLLVQLNHQGIPEIYDFFTESVRSYLVMEYVDGENLEEVLDRTEGMLKSEQVLDWAIQVCDVLVYIHSQNPPIVFRDLKPANIMLRKKQADKIALIDFGIAKAFESGQKGTMIGTEGYSPPEQYKGIADPRGDVYALGATLHHLLTKRDPRLEPPFTFHEEPVRLLNPAVSEEVSSVIMKSLEYDPDKRYPSAQAFKDGLQNALQGVGAPPPPPTTSTTVLPDTSVAPQGGPPAGGQQPPPPQPYPQQPYPYPPQGYPQQPYPPQGYPPPGYPPQGYPQAPSMTGMLPEAEQELDDSILPIWTFTVEDEIRGKSAVADDTSLYVGVYDNNIYALDIKTGEFQWKYPTEGGIAVKPFLYKDRLIFGSEDRVVYAVSTGGRLMWTCPTEGRIRSSAVVEFDHAFFGSDDHRLYAVNAQTGRVIWRYETEGPVRSSPTLGDELVFVGSEDGHLYAVDLSTGASKWKFRANRGITSSPVLYKKELLVVGSTDWNIYGVDAKTGYSAWRARTGNAVISSPVIFEDTVYVGSSDKNLYALDVKTGRTQWKYEVETPVVSTPVVTDQAIYFGTTGGEVISINRKDRKIRWKFRTEGPVTSSPLLHEGVIFIGSTDHKVYALPA